MCWYYLFSFHQLSQACTSCAMRGLSNCIISKLPCWQRIILSVPLEGQYPFEPSAEEICYYNFHSFFFLFPPSRNKMCVPQSKTEWIAILLRSSSVFFTFYPFQKRKLNGVFTSTKINNLCLKHQVIFCRALLIVSL